MTQSLHQRSESGSAIFYIFVAVAFLAALSYAVSQSNRGSIGQLSAQRARILAGDLIDYSNAVAESVGKLRLNGVAETSLCFDAAEWPAGAAYEYNHAACSNEKNMIFSTKGGGVQFRNISPDALKTAFATDNYWVFSGGATLKDIGTHGILAANSELVMYVLGVQDEVCKQANDLIGFADANDALPVDGQFDTAPFVGTFAYNQLVGDLSDIAGKKAACFYSGPGGANIYYRVLLAR